MTPEQALQSKLITSQQFKDIKTNYSNDQWDGIVQETIGHNIQQQAVGAQILATAEQQFPTTIAAAVKVMRKKPPANVHAAPTTIIGTSEVVVTDMWSQYKWPLIVAGIFVAIYLMWPKEQTQGERS